MDGSSSGFEDSPDGLMETPKLEYERFKQNFITGMNTTMIGHPSYKNVESYTPHSNMDNREYDLNQQRYSNE